MKKYEILLHFLLGYVKLVYSVFMQFIMYFTAVCLLLVEDKCVGNKKANNVLIIGFKVGFINCDAVSQLRLVTTFNTFSGNTDGIMSMQRL